MDKQKINEYLNELEGFIADVNTIEIKSQIVFGELDNGAILGKVQ